MSDDDNKVVNITRGTRRNTSDKAPKEPPQKNAVSADEIEKRYAEAVAELNKTYCVIMAGCSVRIMSKFRDDELGRNNYIFISERDFKLRYAHQRIATGISGKGREIIKGLGEAWITHHNRRTYSRLVLKPNGECGEDEYNLWEGFGVDPKAGDWGTILDHLSSVICSGNDDYLSWLLGWMAYCVQNPGRQAETAVVLRGLKGTGKGMVGQILERIFRDHSTHISNMKHLVGNFNAHLMNTLFLFVDEALWAGDKQGEGTLKTLITERRLMIEPKGIDAIPMPNRLKILIASNSDWVVPVSADERRFFVLDVSDCRKGDAEYFKQLNAAINGDELAAFLNYLLNLDISSFDHRNPKHTDGLNQQKLIGGSSVQKFWYDCLMCGEIVGTTKGEWHDTIATQTMHKMYVEHARGNGERHPMTGAIMAKALAKLMPGKGFRRVRPRCGTVRECKYVLPSLDDARAAFLTAMNIDPAKHGWDGDGE